MRDVQIKRGTVLTQNLAVNDFVASVVAESSLREARVVRIDAGPVLHSMI